MIEKFSFNILYGESDIEDGELRLDIERDATEQVIGALSNVNNILLDRIRARLNRRGSGRLYPSKWGKGRKHQASRPGEPPAPDLGLYRDSWEASIQITTDGIVASVVSRLWNVMGRRLELGGAGGGVYIAPRPHVRPVLAQVEPLLEGESK